MNLSGRLPFHKPAKPVKDRDHLARVKSLPCIICFAPPPSDAHHVIHGRYGTRKASDHDTIPLCKLHHQHGPHAIHNGKETWAAMFGEDHSYLPKVREWLEQEIDF